LAHLETCLGKEQDGAAIGRVRQWSAKAVFVRTFEELVPASGIEPLNKVFSSLLIIAFLDTSLQRFILDFPNEFK
jgi:hypothetical protein